MTEKIIIAAVLLAIGAGMGWTAENWRMSGKVATLTGDNKALKLSNDTYVAVNKQCAVNVADVKAAVNGIVNDAKKTNDRANAAMARVAGQADTHQRKASEALSRPPVPPAEWCLALQNEAAAYAKTRRGKR